jgi:hypothetical protein
VKPRSYDQDIDAETDRKLKERLEKNPGLRADIAEARKQIRESIKAEYQIVPPAWTHEWKLDLGRARHFLKGQPLYLRVKFNAAEKSPSGTFQGVWRVGVPRKTPLWHSEEMSLAPDTFHEFRIEPYFDDQGLLTVTFGNLNNTALLFPLEDGLEVLYPEGGFGLNFARGIGIIFCWMALLAALGLAAASFLSFPVAAFLSLGVLTLALSSGTLANAVSEGTLMGYNEETGKTGHSNLDLVAIPVFRLVLQVVNLAKDFSPIDSLSTGRSISWGQLGLAFGQIVGLLGGSLAGFGIVVFNRRELATAQGNS